VVRMSGAGGDASEAKKPCLNMKIGTHNGTFHCDEVFACFMLKQLPEYKNAEIIRTRDPALLDTCDVVVDVGGTYEASKHRYDHHQRSFSDTMNSLNPERKWLTKLSSAGLVYYHFGQRLIAQLLNSKEDDAITNVIYEKVYERFVEAIDAIDNGVDICEGEPRYHMTTGLSSRVGNLNPCWNEKDVNVEERFEAAMTMVGTEFIDRVKYYGSAWWPARELVLEAFTKRTEVDPSGEIVLFKQGGCPWKEHLMNIEEEQGIEGHIKFALFPDQSGNWRVQCVPLTKNSFENRLSLLEKWRGVRDDALSELSGIPGCIFVHASGFIGGNKTYEGALEMARQTLKSQAK